MNKKLKLNNVKKIGKFKITGVIGSNESDFLKSANNSSGLIGLSSFFEMLFLCTKPM